MQVAEIKITYCDYKVYMLQFKYGCYHVKAISGPGVGLSPG